MAKLGHYGIEHGSHVLSSTYFRTVYVAIATKPYALIPYRIHTMADKVAWGYLCKHHITHDDRSLHLSKDKLVPVMLYKRTHTISTGTDCDLMPHVDEFAHLWYELIILHKRYV